MLDIHSRRAITSAGPAPGATDARRGAGGIGEGQTAPQPPRRAQNGAQRPPRTLWRRLRHRRRARARQAVEEGGLALVLLLVGVSVAPLHVYVFSDLCGARRGKKSGRDAPCRLPIRRPSSRNATKGIQNTPCSMGVGVRSSNRPHAPIPSLSLTNTPPPHALRSQASAQRSVAAPKSNLATGPCNGIAAERKRTTAPERWRGNCSRE